METSTKVPVPEHLKAEVAKACSEWQSPLMFTLSERLQDIGLETHIAVHVEVNILMTWACRMAYLAARILERRAPDPDQWTAACQQELQRTETWFAENYKDAPPIEEPSADGKAVSA